MEFGKLGLKFLNGGWSGVFGCFPTQAVILWQDENSFPAAEIPKCLEIFQVESVTSEVFSNLNHSMISKGVLELLPPHRGPLGGLILPDPTAPPPEIQDQHSWCQDLGSHGQLLFPTKPALNPSPGAGNEPPSPSSSSKSHGSGSRSLTPVGSSLPLIPVRTFPVLRSPPLPGSRGTPDPTGKGGVG